MATTPEEFFAKGLMEQSLPFPHVFPDLPAGEPNSSSEGQHHIPNDMMLPYISRVLLEDDVDDKLINHPGLLQVQQPFAQILSSPSFGTNTSNTEGANDLLEYSCPDNEVVLAFLKGMENANMLLPKENKFRSGDEQLNQIVSESRNHSGIKKRYNRDDHLEEVVVKSGKAPMTMIKEPEEKCENEMLDEMMLHGYETCIRGMNKLRVDMDNEVEGKHRKSGRKVARYDVVDMRTLLISCAEEIARNNHVRAHELLNQIKHHALETGDATQRLARCFTKGLEARLLGTGSQLWKLSMAERPSFLEFLKAYNLYFAACSFNKVTLIFTKLTIMQAMVGKTRLHLVDYGMLFGFQWAGLLRLLASREGAPPEVKITAIGYPKPKPYPTHKIEEIGCRLSKCAHEFGLLSFKFRAIMTNWEDTCSKDYLKADGDEVLIVNDLFNFSTLMDDSVFSNEPSPRDTVLSNIKKMRPDVFIQSTLNRSYGSSFLTRFREILFYYMAIFDMLDATVPRKSKSRLVLEQVVLGRSALNAIACEGADLVERPEKYRQWQARNQRAGLRQLPLKSSIVNVVKDEVRKHHHKDFFICEDGQWLLQGWMGRVLFAHSTWVADDTSSP